MEPSEVILASDKMKTVMALVRRVAPTECSVLVRGESGVGKELVAQEIHRWSRRSGGPFVVLNCGAIPEGLLESELFGYEAGAFTGASKHGKPGMFEQADGGTLLLDEVADLPLTLQVKLLRVLQDLTIYRVGGRGPRKVDVRVLASTNQSLLDMAETGQFRLDLYYRLNVVTIHVPPLRERSEDLEAAIAYFLQLYNRKHGYQRRMTPELRRELMVYHWPGNMRQVQHLIERLVITSDTDDLGLAALPQRLRKAMRGEDRRHRVRITALMPLAEGLAETERQLLVMALTQCSSTRAVARALGISQSTVVRKLREYRLRAPQT